MNKIKISAGLIVVALLIVSGCVFQQPPAPGGQTSGATPLPTTALPPADHSSTPAVPTSNASGSSTAQPTAKLKDIFISVAYGLGETGLTKWDIPVVKVGVTGEYSAADQAFLKEFSRTFNDLSPTKIQYYWGFENEPVELVILPESSIRDLHLTGSGDNRHHVTHQLLYKTMVPPYGLYLQKRYYINKDVTESRNYSLQRALLDGLGFPGQSEETDSFFNKYNDVSTTLNEDDTIIIRMMYEMDIHAGDMVTRVNTFLH